MQLAAMPRVKCYKKCWMHQIPFKHLDKAILGQDSTWTGEQLGTSSAAVIGLDTDDAKRLSPMMVL